MQPHPWFRPRYRRVLTLAFILAWVVVEAVLDPFGLFFWLILGVAAWTAWDFFLAGKYP